MQFTTTVFSAVALFVAGQAMGAAIDNDQIEAREANIATSPYYACNCPNNCSYRSGSSCKYYGGPSDKSTELSGKCYYVGNYLSCVAN
ncbi:hypothetical protein BJ170DRAFT_678322 [Xylariales sp. AK1849]|nr:hypothetical protein BJ170DRAFT_678322 [Xylariales sp. AK1849]